MCVALGPLGARAQRQRPPARAAAATPAAVAAAAPLQRWRAASPQQPLPGRRAVSCRVLTESATLEVGSPAPPFELPEPLTGKRVSLSALAEGSTAVLVAFICHHCPFVVMLKPVLAALAREYQGRGVAVVAVTSNSLETHPQDGPENMRRDVEEFGYTFPFLLDEDQEVAKAYRAACTPEFYVFDQNLRLTYHGQFDDARPNNGKPVTGADLRTALDAALAGGGLPEGFTPKPSIGCNIKWRPGGEPDYFGSQVVKK